MKGKSLPRTAAAKLRQELGGITSRLIVTPKSRKPASQNSAVRPEVPKTGGGLKKRPKSERMTESTSAGENQRTPLSRVVSDCVKRWFEETLKEAKAGDISMQVLVGQMYYNGYGVTKDAHKGKIWMTRASKYRSSAWRVSDKRPGYNASDSDSEEEKVNS
ncbi:hypothetical protein NMG60_11035972 [Bertholletia excelsa]